MKPAPWKCHQDRNLTASTNTRESGNEQRQRFTVGPALASRVRQHSDRKGARDQDGSAEGRTLKAGGKKPQYGARLPEG